MMTINEELFLNEYFMLTALTATTDGKNVFYKLGDAFFVGTNRLDALWDKVSSEEITSITTEQEYFRSMRVRQFFELMDKTYYSDRETEELIEIKGKALSLLAEHKLCFLDDVGATSFSDRIKTLSAGGDVLTMRLFGLMLCEGLVFEKDVEAGERYLSATALWCNVPGMLLELYYSAENRQKNIARLCDAVKLTPFCRLVGQCMNAYGTEASDLHSSAVTELQRAFADGTASPDRYDPALAARLSNGGKRRFGFSEVMNNEN